MRNISHRPQTDSTRSRQQELHYQERLTAELQKLHDQESQTFTSYSETLSGESPDPSTSSEPGFLEKATTSKATLAEKQRQKDMSNASVTKEVEALKKKLESRKNLTTDTQVDRAKEEVVKCLRANDRRPLDCWKEIEGFKREVGRLEREFVERTIS